MNMPLGTVADAIPSAWGLLTISFILGMVAVISPGSLTRERQGAAAWIDSSRLLAVLAHPKVSHWLLKHSRLFGVTVMASSAVLACVLSVVGGR